MEKRFEEVAVRNNFYQSSSFYPMPTILVTTLDEEGRTNIGAYSLCFPFGIAENHYMMLISREDSNTAKNIRRDKKAALNFIPYKRKYLKNTVKLGYPGETTEQKLKDSIFTLVASQRDEEGTHPQIIDEAVQVFECTWEDSDDIFYFSQENGAHHFLLRIDKILLKEKWKNALERGKGFPSLPVDYGYRDAKNFWFARHMWPYSEPIPKDKGVSVSTVRYETTRLGYDNLEWDDEALEKLVKIPRIFLKKALVGIAQEAEKQGVTIITTEFVEMVNEKRKRK